MMDNLLSGVVHKGITTTRPIKLLNRPVAK